MRRLVDEGRFAAVLNCGGSCALKACELDAEMARRVNVDGIESLLSALDPHPEIRFVHLSIDLVFSGTNGGRYFERDATDPVTNYGKTMVEAEELILRRRPQSCILRISLPMGVSFNGHAGAIDWIQSRFKNSRPATLYFDEVRTPTYVECLNEVVEEACSADFTGVFHAGGSRELSLFQIAQIVNLVGGYDPSLLHGCYRIQAGLVPPRAGNVTMNSQKLHQELSRQPFVPWPMNDQLVPTFREWHYDRAHFIGSPSQIARVLYRRPWICRPPFGDSIE
jgi:dTDP-4-dehydrorhamnose reductase